MRNNRIRERWERSEAAVCGWISSDSAYLAEIAGWSGVDCVAIDLQHGMTDFSTLPALLQAVAATPAVPLVRVPACEAALLMKSLDLGAYGVICPMIGSVEEAMRFVAATVY